MVKQAGTKLCKLEENIPCSALHLVASGSVLLSRRTSRSLVQGKGLGSLRMETKRPRSFFGDEDLSALVTREASHRGTGRQSPLGQQILPTTSAECMSRCVILSFEHTALQDIEEAQGPGIRRSMSRITEEVQQVEMGRQLHTHWILATLPALLLSAVAEFFEINSFQNGASLRVHAEDPSGKQTCHLVVRGEVTVVHTYMGEEREKKVTAGGSANMEALELCLLDAGGGRAHKQVRPTYAYVSDSSSCVTHAISGHKLMEAVMAYDDAHPETSVMSSLKRMVTLRGVFRNEAGLSQLSELGALDPELRQHVGLLSHEMVLVGGTSLEITQLPTVYVILSGQARVTTSSRTGVLFSEGERFRTGALPGRGAGVTEAVAETEILVLLAIPTELPGKLDASPEAIEMRRVHKKQMQEQIQEQMKYRKQCQKILASIKRLEIRLGIVEAFNARKAWRLLRNRVKLCISMGVSSQIWAASEPAPVSILEEDYCNLVREEETLIAEVNARRVQLNQLHQRWTSVGSPQPSTAPGSKEVTQFLIPRSDAYLSSGRLDAISAWLADMETEMLVKVRARRNEIDRLQKQIGCAEDETTDFHDRVAEAGVGAAALRACRAEETRLQPRVEPRITALTARLKQLWAVLGVEAEAQAPFLEADGGSLDQCIQEVEVLERCHGMVERATTRATRSLRIAIGQNMEAVLRCVECWTALGAEAADRGQMVEVARLATSAEARELLEARAAALHEACEEKRQADREALEVVERRKEEEEVARLASEAEARRQAAEDARLEAERRFQAIEEANRQRSQAEIAEVKRLAAEAEARLQADLWAANNSRFGSEAGLWDGECKRLLLEIGTPAEEIVHLPTEGIDASGVARLEDYARKLQAEAAAQKQDVEDLLKETTALLEYLRVDDKNAMPDLGRFNGMSLLEKKAVLVQSLRHAERLRDRRLAERAALEVRRDYLYEIYATPQKKRMAIDSILPDISEAGLKEYAIEVENIGAKKSKWSIFRALRNYLKEHQLRIIDVLNAADDSLDKEISKAELRNELVERQMPLDGPSFNSLCEHLGIDKKQAVSISKFLQQYHKLEQECAVKDRADIN
ncbi:hypothetical protein CYMTET_5302 [Cymbomonas tetramitiformis]|uniref:Uncharacterized protein n=1 Tax=Cymbomonas tetramitiformis TaxID=36881 RepID=A0AAE0GZP6_9CHLO|nr:hypothetical protein CYMTET_5302 [Cymbomonas tetramitiformis]|eukprot:gene5614-6799_t